MVLKMAQVGLSWSSSGPDSTPKQAPIRPGDRKNLSISNLQETKVSLSAIYQTRADNEYETNVNASSRLHSLASRWSN